tara:strand:+ start:21 stop:797 length:777 start_codon:yes stop_codon:yes gene_type:complete
MTLSIIISALGSNLNKINHWISSEILEKVNEIIIVVQNSKGYEKEINTLENLGCKLIIDNKIGLSRSRNIGIKNSTSDYFWILDDDIYTDKAMIDSIIDSIENNISDIYTFRIAKNKEGELYKKYLNKRHIDKLHILKVSSIEIVISKKMIDKHSILFNEKFGIGAKYPICEESLFLLECLNYGLKIIHIPKVIVVHEALSARFKPIANNALIAQGYLCKKIGVIGFALIIRWYFRIIIKYRKIFAIKYLIRGYRLKI